MSDSKQENAHKEFTAGLDAIGVPPVPPDLAAKARQEDIGSVCLGSMQMMLQLHEELNMLARRIQKRCRVCTPAEQSPTGKRQLCANCIADAATLAANLFALGCTARFFAEATSPGSVAAGQLDELAKETQLRNATPAGEA